MSVSASVHAFICTYISVCVCVCIYIYIRHPMYIYISMHLQVSKVGDCCRG